ncbi:glutamic-type intramembrane protease PrsW [Bacillus sp. FJAT-45350]|uniref:glutamic-type intramembrane protease PrsW n=1 Tax=Bacillus sp. FJAT-45350 TaxID=2011014 RepID=UPI000BB9A0D4
MLSLITAAAAPGLALLSYFYLRNGYGLQTIGQVTKSFIMGILLVFPVMVLQYAFIEEGFFLAPIYKAFILSGLIEEFFKWFLLFFVSYKHGNFTKPYDGIVFGVSLSLGFATAENLFYLFAYGIETALGRALLPVASHAIFGVMMGYYLGRARFELDKNKWLILSLVIPILIHGGYDYILIISADIFIYTMIPLMIALWWLALSKVKQANERQVL